MFQSLLPVVLAVANVFINVSPACPYREELAVSLIIVENTEHPGQTRAQVRSTFQRAVDLAWMEWHKTNKPGEFLTFLGARLNQTDPNWHAEVKRVMAIQNIQI